MADGTEVRKRGAVFDEIADRYDRHRPAYPDALVDRACEVAQLAADAEVLEVGCGTGQLTRSLLARRLRVVAVEPGAQLLTRARDHLEHGHGEIEFVHARLEDASLPAADFQAAFSASAIHWVDPDVGWRTIAGALTEGGTLALLSYFGLRDPRSDADQGALAAALDRVAPELAGTWPVQRDLAGTLAGVRERAGNVSEAWAWLGGYDVARGYVADLFEDVEIIAIPVPLEHTADALGGLLTTLSLWARLTSRQRAELGAELHALQRRLGRPIRSSTVACLVTAQLR